MGYYLTIGVCSFAVPFVMIVFGLHMLLKSSKNRGAFFGYRTLRSVKSDEAWTFANRRAGLLWTLIGFVMGIANVFIFKWVLGFDDVKIIMCIYMIVQIVILIGVFYPVEKALRKHFDKEGNRI